MRLALTAIGLVLLLSLASASLAFAALGSLMGSNGVGSNAVAGSTGMMGSSAVTASGSSLAALASQPWLTGTAAVLIVLGAAMVLLWALRSVARELRRPPQVADDEPLLLLQRRYARGEINSDEYARVRADLT
jgi:uncharacterized membrane protein